MHSIISRAVFASMVLGIMVFVDGCAPKKKLTPDHNFYFEIITHRGDALSKELTGFLKREIPKKKYAITNHSGLSWPFYKELNLEESIPQDSLMPPHWYLHKMVPLENSNNIKRDEFFVKIDLFPKPDTIPNYSVTIFRMDSTGLKLSAESGIHFIDSTKFTSGNSLFDIYLRSIIRYSFK